MWTHHLHLLQLSRNPSKLYSFNPLILTQYFTGQQTRLATGNNPPSPKLLSQFMVVIKIENLMARLNPKLMFLLFLVMVRVRMLVMLVVKLFVMVVCMCSSCGAVCLIYIVLDCACATILSPKMSGGGVHKY